MHKPKYLGIEDGITSWEGYVFKSDYIIEHESDEIHLHLFEKDVNDNEDAYQGSFSLDSMREALVILKELSV